MCENDYMRTQVKHHKMKSSCFDRSSIILHNTVCCYVGLGRCFELHPKRSTSFIIIECCEFACKNFLPSQLINQQLELARWVLENKYFAYVPILPLTSNIIIIFFIFSYRGHEKFFVFLHRVTNFWLSATFLFRECVAR